MPEAGACEPPEHIQASKHMELPALGSNKSLFECVVCGRKFAGLWVLRQHQVDTGHFSSDDSKQLRSQREQDAAGLAEALARLDDAMSE